MLKSASMTLRSKVMSWAIKDNYIQKFMSSLGLAKSHVTNHIDADNKKDETSKLNKEWCFDKETDSDLRPRKGLTPKLWENHTEILRNKGLKNFYNKENRQTIDAVFTRINAAVRISEESKETPDELKNFKVQRVIGADIYNKHFSLQLHSDGTKSGTSEKFIYFIKKIVTIDYYNIGIQEYYFGHKHNITAIKLSTKNLIASADFKSQTRIHIWDLKSKETIQIIKGTYFTPVCALEFLNSNKYLASATHQKVSKVFVHDIATADVIFAVNVSQKIERFCSKMNDLTSINFNAQLNQITSQTGQRDSVRINSTSKDDGDNHDLEKQNDSFTLFMFSSKKIYSVSKIIADNAEKFLKQAKKIGSLYSKITAMLSLDQGPFIKFIVEEDRKRSLQFKTNLGGHNQMSQLEKTLFMCIVDKMKSERKFSGKSPGYVQAQFNGQLICLGHENGKLTFWYDLQFITELEIRKESPINCIVSNETGIFVQFDRFNFIIFDHNFDKVKEFAFKEEKLMKLPSDQLLTCIALKKELYLFTDRLEIFRYKFKIEKVEKREKNETIDRNEKTEKKNKVNKKIKFKLSRLHPIPMFGSSLNYFKILSKDKTCMVIFCISDNELVNYDFDKRDYTETFKFKQKILAFDAIVNKSDAAKGSQKIIYAVALEHEKTIQFMKKQSKNINGGSGEAKGNFVYADIITINKDNSVSHFAYTEGKVIRVVWAYQENGATDSLYVLNNRHISKISFTKGSIDDGKFGCALETDSAQLADMEFIPDKNLLLIFSDDNHMLSFTEGSTSTSIVAHKGFQIGSSGYVQTHYDRRSSMIPKAEATLSGLKGKNANQANKKQQDQPISNEKEYRENIQANQDLMEEESFGNVIRCHLETNRLLIFNYENKLIVCPDFNIAESEDQNTKRNQPSQKKTDFTNTFHIQEYNLETIKYFYYDHSRKLIYAYENDMLIIMKLEFFKQKSNQLQHMMNQNCSDHKKIQHVYGQNYWRYYSRRIRDSQLMAEKTYVESLNFLKYVKTEHMPQWIAKDNKAVDLNLALRLKERYPRITLHLSHIYGFNGKEFRNNFRFIHKYDDEIKVEDGQDEGQKNQTELAQVNLQDDKIKDLKISGVVKYPYDCSHKGCEKELVYFVSKYGVVCNLKGSDQKFYKGHRYNITAMALSKSKRIVATGDTSPYEDASIHLWSAYTCEAIRIFTPMTISSFFRIDFSNFDDYICCIGINLEQVYCLEVFDLNNRIKLTSVFLSKTPVYDLIFNNYCSNEFTIAEHDRIKKFKINGSQIDLKEHIILYEIEQMVHNLSNAKVHENHDRGFNVQFKENFSEKPTSDNHSEIHYNHYKEASKSVVVTVIQYFYYLLGNEVDTDYIVGTADGSLGIVANGSYEEIKSKAHAGPINAIKITDVMRKVIVIITAGHDRAIKFWSSKMTLLKTYDLDSYIFNRRTFFDHNTNEKYPRAHSDESMEYSIQNLDIYACNLNNKSSALNNKLEQSAWLLVTTGHNEVFEIGLRSQYQGLETQKQTSDETKKALIELQQKAEMLQGQKQSQVQNLKNDDASQNKIAHKEILAITNIDIDQKLLFHFNSSFKKRVPFHELKEYMEDRQLKFEIIEDKELILVYGIDSSVFIWSCKDCSFQYCWDLTPNVPVAIKYIPFEDGRSFIFILFQSEFAIYDYIKDESNKQSAVKFKERTVFKKSSDFDILEKYDINDFAVKITKHEKSPVAPETITEKHKGEETVGEIYFQKLATFHIYFIIKQKPDSADKSVLAYWMIELINDNTPEKLFKGKKDEQSSPLVCLLGNEMRSQIPENLRKFEVKVIRFFKVPRHIGDRLPVSIEAWELSESDETDQNFGLFVLIKVANSQSQNSATDFYTYQIVRENLTSIPEIKTISRKASSKNFLFVNDFALSKISSVNSVSANQTNRNIAGLSNDQLCDLMLYSDSQDKLEEEKKIDNDKKSEGDKKGEVERKFETEKKYEYIIACSEYGQILVCKNPTEIFKLGNMPFEFQARVYPAHATPITLIRLLKCTKINRNFLLTTSQNDDCIIQWQVLNNSNIRDNEAGYLLTAEPQSKLASDLETKAISQIPKDLKQKDNDPAPEIATLKNNQKISHAEKNRFELHMKLRKVIGRRALDRQNNVFISANNKILFISGTLISMINLPNPVSMDRYFMEINGKSLTDSYEQGEDENMMSLESLISSQEFLMQETQMEEDFTCPQISTFCLSSDRKEVCIGTQERSAYLYFWEISSKYFKYRIQLEDAREISNIVYSDSDNFIAVVAVTPTDGQVVYFVCNETGKIPRIIAKADLNKSLHFKIKACIFMPESDFVFYTFGVEHAARWELQESILTFTELVIKNFVTNTESKVENQKTYSGIPFREPKTTYGSATFLCATFINNNILIAGTETGHMNFWQNNDPLQVEIGHIDSKSSNSSNTEKNFKILCISSSKRFSGILIRSFCYRWIRRQRFSLGDQQSDQPNCPCLGKEGSL